MTAITSCIPFVVMAASSSNLRGPLIIAAIVGTCVLIGWWIFANFFQTYHLATVDEGVLYRDGLRTFREYQTALGRVRARHVISLVDPEELRKEPFNQEQDYCRRAKVEYSSITIPLGGWPTSENVHRFLMLVKTKKYQPTLVHCAQGVRRTGMLVAAYQMSVLGWDKEKTRSAILTFGHSDRTVGDIKKFIEVYDPVAMTVPSDLPKGKE